MRKSKKRVIAIITCCFVLCTFCIGVFADYNDDRLGTMLNIRPYDLGDLAYTVSDTAVSINEGYYIAKLTYNHQLPNSYTPIVLNDNLSILSYYKSSETYIFMYYHDSSNRTINFNYVEGDVVYIYCYYSSSSIVYASENSNGYYVSMELYEINDNTDINIYSNSQDVHGSIVNVINEATNVITTNDVIMMFCILIPVISFGVGILIRLRKRA